MYIPFSLPARRTPQRLLMALALLTGLTLWMSPPADAGYYPPAHSDAAYFHDSLAPYGTWTHHGSYGAVWYPHGVAHGWRPYTQGRWVWDDSYGWTWASAFAWGWAPFHYGNWVWDAAFGWIWVPGRTWAPAWVTWRYSDSYIGWAPIGYGVNWWSYNPGWNYGGWNYVHRHHFGAPVIHRHVIVVKQYQTIYHTTRHWAPPRNAHNRIAHRGFDRGFVERGSRYKVDRVNARPEHWQRNDHRSGSSGRNEWRDTRRDGPIGRVPERRIEGRTDRQHDPRWNERPSGTREFRPEARQPDRQRQLLEQQRRLQQTQQSRSRQVLEQQRQIQERQRPPSQALQQQRQRYVQEQPRVPRTHLQQRPSQQVLQQQRQRQTVEHQRSRQTHGQQRQFQIQQRQRQTPPPQRQIRAERQIPSQAQAPQRQVQAQRAPAVQRQQPQRREQRVERREADYNGGRDVGRSWR